ncbi:MAG: hypothetical protein H7A35_06215 [Planctomycetales bacterium]|nr:hypothetical protein [bacterium]UNM09653.1 MAG: hypothetical protein H7A35_06215 [Planctomycetales bacterium]
MLRYCLSLLALCLIATGCNRHGQASASEAASFPMPLKWPVAAIAVPPDATPAALPGAFPADEGDPYRASGMPFNERSENSGHMWSTAYTCPLSWEEQLGLFNSQHEELGYQLNWDKPLTREFISTDGKYITQLYLDVENGVSVLSIFVYDDGWPGARPMDS